MYHHERGRRYRPTKIELETNTFFCPHCGVQMGEVKIRASEKVLSCPGCKWSIHRDDLWQPAADEEPALRAPGEATNAPPEPTMPFDMSLEQAVNQGAAEPPPPEPPVENFDIGVEDALPPVRVVHL